ncbi:MAG: MogA/MoaB family molybdenum cofactor biosynthesis protein [Desulfovibrio desulfuricans]|jgi:molybdenum cofactor synthesis domain-containing protein|nr:MogA/MoaB family molybdenum cofactor biosynthesis protein [Desulfovibrio desulfuricans]
MKLPLHIHACAQGQCLPLRPDDAADIRGHAAASRVLREAALLSVGTRLCAPDGTPLFAVTGKAWLPVAGGHAADCPLLTALADVRDGPLDAAPRKEGYSLAWVTLSDKGAHGLREDASGPAIAALAAAALPLCHSQGFLLPDEAPRLRALLTELALHQGYDCICTTGGTGLSPRDITPQVTAALLDAPLPGFTQAMLAASLAKTPHAVISRAAAGTLGRSIIINLPGSRKAVEENLAAVLPALPHALAKLQGDPADCGAQ